MCAKCNNEFVIVTQQGGAIRVEPCECLPTGMVEDVFPFRVGEGEDAWRCVGCDAYLSTPEDICPCDGTETPSTMDPALFEAISAHLVATPTKETAHKYDCAHVEWARSPAGAPACSCVAEHDKETADHES